jgi:hypothetical protein
MDATETTLEGTIQPDGILVLDGPTNLPPGRVEVVVRMAAPGMSPQWAAFFRMMDEMRADQEARGQVSLAHESIAEIQRMDEESERDLEAIARFQEEGRSRREDADREAGAV